MIIGITLAFLLWGTACFFVGAWWTGLMDGNKDITIELLTSDLVETRKRLYDMGRSRDYWHDRAMSDRPKRKTLNPGL